MELAAEEIGKDAQDAKQSDFEHHQLPTQLSGERFPSHVRRNLKKLLLCDEPA